MGKYEPLARFLEARNEDSWTATFDQIEKKLGFQLPRSAHEYRAWWSNQRGPGHSQKEAWQMAGWETREVDLDRGVVRFARQRVRPLESASGLSSSDLWQQAIAVTGITDREKLIERALLALIRHEAAQALIRMGGSDPDAKPAPRKRPWG
jgi:hypothetical protein